MMLCKKSMSWLVAAMLMASCSESKDPKKERGTVVGEEAKEEAIQGDAETGAPHEVSSDEKSGKEREAGVTNKALATPPKSEAVTAWSRLLALNCDGKLAGVWTPIQAKIIRNAPRAIGNGPIQDTRIQNYYEQAHEGYDGTHQGLLNLDRDAGKCMARMKGWEEVLRETTTWSLKEGVEGRLIQSIQAFHFLQEATKGSQAFPFGVVESGVETNGRIWVKAYGRDCEPMADGMGVNTLDPCLKLEISCWSTGPCTGQVL